MLAVLMAIFVFMLSLFTIDPLLWSSDDLVRPFATNLALSALSVALLYFGRRGKPRLPKIVSIPLAVLLAAVIAAMGALIFVFSLIADAVQHFSF